MPNYTEEYCEELGRPVYIIKPKVGADEQHSMLDGIIKNDFANLVRIIKSYYWPKVEVAEAFINSLIEMINSKFGTDKAIFDSLKSMYTSQFQKDEGDRAKTKASAIVATLHKARIRVQHDADYLDIGCYDGKITTEIAAQLGIDLSSVHGVDVIEYCNYPFDFQLIKNEFLPFESETIDMITCLMSLHHVSNVQMSLSEIWRVLKIGGLFMIREHNVEPTDKAAANLLYVQHALFDYVWSDKTWNVGNIEEHPSYNTAEGWRTIIEKTGFELVWPKKMPQAKSPLAKITQIYVKKQRK